MSPGQLGRHPRPVVGDPAGGRGGSRGRAGRPAVRGHVVDLRADAVRGVRHRADPPGGPRRLPHAQRLPPRLGATAGSSSSAGRRSTSATPRAPGCPTGASITCTTPDGKPVQLEVESLLPVPLHVGGGYGGDPDWLHGQWKGAGFTERVTYDLTDESVAGRIMFGVIDHAARALCHEEGRRRRRGLGALRARRPRPARPQRLRRLVHPRPLTTPPEDA